MTNKNVACYLVDYNGNRISPYDRDGIHYKVLSFYELQTGNEAITKMIVYSIRGYIKCVTLDGVESLPIPFEIIRKQRIIVESDASFEFGMKAFECRATFRGRQILNAYIRVYIHIDTEIIPVVKGKRNEIGLFVEDKKQIHCHMQLIRGEVYQYHAFGDGVRKVFTNKQQQEEVSGKGLLPPETVSFCQVFVNGLLVSKSHYRLEAGRLMFTTKDSPGMNEPITVVYISLYSRKNHILTVQQDQYVARAEGKRMLFTREHDLGTEEKQVIRPPSKVSKYNLYVNGVLQPPYNYLVKAGCLEFVTEDAPADGEMVILETIRLFGERGELLHMDEISYSTSYEGCKVIRSKQGIIPRQEASYQILYVNGAIQSRYNYLVEPECLTLLTKDEPIEGGMITLQSIRAAIIN